jgi:hypothetical protein
MNPLLTKMKKNKTVVLTTMICLFNSIISSIPTLTLLTEMRDPTIMKKIRSLKVIQIKTQAAETQIVTRKVKASKVITKVPNKCKEIINHLSSKGMSMTLYF